MDLKEEKIRGDRIGDYVAKTRPDTLFLIMVPAFQFFFSAHDLFLGHRRRYTIGAIKEGARRAGLEILRSNYFFAIIFPLASARRIVEKIQIGRGQMRPRSSLRVHGRLVNRTLKFACAIEQPLFRLNRFFGLSAFCLARISARASSKSLSLRNIPTLVHINSFRSPIILAGEQPSPEFWPMTLSIKSICGLALALFQPRPDGLAA